MAWTSSGKGEEIDSAICFLSSWRQDCFRNIFLFKCRERIRTFTKAHKLRPCRQMFVNISTHNTYTTMSSILKKKILATLKDIATQSQDIFVWWKAKDVVALLFRDTDEVSKYTDLAQPLVSLCFCPTRRVQEGSLWLLKPDDTTSSLSCGHVTAVVKHFFSEYCDVPERCSASSKF